MLSGLAVWWVGVGGRTVTVTVTETEMGARQLGFFRRDSRQLEVRGILVRTSR